jgi:two-component system, NtrC family, response regulator PilR
MPSVLLVDDEPNIIEILEIVLRDEGMEVSTANSGNEALEKLRKADYDVVVSDIRMPDLSGVELLKKAKALTPDTIFVLITAHAGTDSAIEALQHGAYDYLTKPFKMDELRQVVHRALDNKRLKQEAAASPNQPEVQQGQKLFQALYRSQIVGKSAKMLEVYRTIGTVAGGESTILVTGESGTGKELVARAIHEASPRKNRPFVSINCGAFPETLLESELFGYIKGAFTGATGNKKGLFEAADGGSIFLDEVTEMTPAMQVKLLRVLQERRLRPLGGTTEVPLDVRVIAATNRDLQATIRLGLFREDLYYRIAVITLNLPPLRERTEDIELLSFHFMRQCIERTGKRISGISPAAMRLLTSYSWPGNVRELENTIERAVALEATDSIQPDRLPEALHKPAPALPSQILPVPDEGFDLQVFLAQTERTLICTVLSQTGGNQTLAAQRLNLTKPSLRHRIQVLGIDAPSFRRNGS